MRTVVSTASLVAYLHASKNHTCRVAGDRAEDRPEDPATLKAAEAFESLVQDAVTAAYVARRDREVDPEGTFDTKGRWEPDPIEDISARPRWPGRTPTSKLAEHANTSGCSSRRASGGSPCPTTFSHT